VLPLFLTKKLRKNYYFSKNNNLLAMRRTHFTKSDPAHPSAEGQAAPLQEARLVGVANATGRFLTV